MSPYEIKQRQKKRKSFFRKWHRRLGFFACLLLFNLAITGFLLNHYQSFSLHQSYVSSSWIIQWYGIKAPETATCFQAQPVAQDKRTACQLGEVIYLKPSDNKTLINLNQSLSTPLQGQLIGLFNADDFLYLVTSDQVVLLTQDNELIDLVEFRQTQSKTIDRAFVNEDQHLLLQSGNELLQFDLDQMRWSSLVDGSAMHESQSVQADKKSLEQMQNNYLSHQISHLKLVQDIHSGVFFFGNGKLLSDLAALSIFLLAISGVIAWQRRRGREQA